MPGTCLSPVVEEPAVDVIEEYKDIDYGTLMEYQINSLNSAFKDAQASLSQVQVQLRLHLERTKQLITEWKIRIHEAESQLFLQRRERDTELKEITAQLLFFEGQLKREQSSIQLVLQQKDDIIFQQTITLEKLKRKNRSLQNAVRDVWKEIVAQSAPNEQTARLQMAPPSEDKTPFRTDDENEKLSKIRPHLKQTTGINEKSYVSIDTSARSREFPLTSNLETRFSTKRGTKHLGYYKTTIDENMDPLELNTDVGDAAVKRGSLQWTRAMKLTNECSNAKDSDENIEHLWLSMRKTNSKELTISDARETTRFPFTIVDLASGDSVRRQEFCWKAVKSETRRDPVQRSFRRPKDVKRKHKSRAHTKSLTGEEHHMIWNNRTLLHKQVFSFLI